MAEHWNGKSWTRVASPDPGSSDNVLDGVSDVARNAAWAVGFYQVGRSARFRTMIAAWDGKTWSKVASPDSPLPDNYQFDVASVSRSEAWAVRYDQASFSSRLRTLLLHWNGNWNGHVWSKVVIPHPGQLNELGGVVATSPANAWTVGDYCVKASKCVNFERLRTMIMHWNGRKWCIR